MSNRKTIMQSLLQIYLQENGQIWKSEKIIDRVKKETQIYYIFGDTILRALRQLRSDGKLDYDIIGEKRNRNYKWK
jgi:hypothetical protein